MAETKQMPNANKLALSRALGAAFLNHQVEQLEKSVSNGPGSGNWRDRGRGHANGNPQLPMNGAKRGGAPSSPGVKVATRKKAGEVQVATKERTAPTKGVSGEYERSATRDAGTRRRSNEETRGEKDADVIVVDASVLVHALYQVKKWCREGRQEIVIVPLEALNTLDLLKKGTSPLAQRARAASRILEAQVGTNPRIRVQRDDAFLLWDSIMFKEDPTEQDSTAKSGAANPSPEWVRRTICCARWEVDHAEETVKTTNPGRGPTSTPRTSSDGNKNSGKKPKVILAVLSSPPNMSPQLSTLKLTDAVNASTPLTPVPLPAPTVPHPNKHEPRSSGTLVAHWGSKAGIQLMEVEPTIPGRGGEEDVDRGKRPNNAILHQHPHAHGHGGHGHSKGRRGSATEGAPRPPPMALVERPPAVMAMMEMVAQPSKVVRVLARGEKLDPDP